MYPLFPLFELVVAAHAEAPLTMADLFPEAPLAAAQAGELLTPERIGPPARSYDQTTVTPGFARAEETAIEQALFGAAYVPPSDALRRYSRGALALMRHGRMHNRIEWFLAEHAGLATVPQVTGTFATSDLDPAAVSKLVADFVPRDADVRSVALAVERDEAFGGWVGVVTAIYAAADFEPFPRVHAPGGVAVIPGTLLAGDAKYALYVSYPGTEVREFPLSGKGAFDVEVPLPAEPGVYRVTMNKHKKRQLPDSAFFFTLYVGQEPPVAFTPDPFGAGVPTTGHVEKDFLAQLNHARERHGLAPFTWVDRSADLRAALAGMPPWTRKVAMWRYVRQVAERDPMPGTPHGAWAPAFTDGQDAAEAAWTAIEHPITRQSFLGPDYTLLAAGAMEEPGQGVYVLSFAVEPGSDPLAARDQAYAELRRRQGGTSGSEKDGSTARAMIQGKLDVVAAEVASGKRTVKAGMAAATKEIKALQKEGWIGGGVAWTITVLPPGEVPTLEGFSPPADAKNFAIGAAHGDLGEGRGFDYTVLVVLASSHME